MTRKTSNSRRKPAEPERLSRLQICKKYGLTEQTLRIVTDEAGLVSLESERVHGRILYSISAEDDEVLSLAKICPYSLQAFRPPSLRYIMYSLLVGTVDEAVDGLAFRGLASARVNRTSVEAVRTAMCAALPAELTKFIGTGAVPPAKLLPTFELIMEILSLSMIYEAPEALDALCFPEQRMVDFLNQLVSTHSCTDTGRAGVVVQALGHAAVTAEGLMIYRSLFHDVGFMRPEDLNIYMAGLSPSIRAAYQRAIELTTADFAIENQFFSEQLVEYKHMGRVLRQRARELLSSSSREDLAAAGHVITTIRQLDDFIGKVHPNEKPKDTPSFLRDVTIVEYDFDERLPHLKGQHAAKIEDAG